MQLIEGAEIAGLGCKVDFGKNPTSKTIMSLLKLQKILSGIRPIQVISHRA